MKTIEEVIRSELNSRRSEIPVICSKLDLSERDLYNFIQGRQTLMLRDAARLCEMLGLVLVESDDN